MATYDPIPLPYSRAHPVNDFIIVRFVIEPEQTTIIDHPGEFKLSQLPHESTISRQTPDLKSRLIRSKMDVRIKRNGTRVRDCVYMRACVVCI